VPSKFAVVLLAIKFVLCFMIGQMAVPPFEFRKSLCQISHSYFHHSTQLFEVLCLHYMRPERFSTRLCQPKVCSSMDVTPFLRAELSREAPSELTVDKFLKTSSCNLRSLLNLRSEMHLTSHQTQLLTQQITKVVSLG
jgi:hypothetical protein